MKTSLTRKDGSGLLTTMIVIVVLSLVTATFVSIGKQRAFTTQKLADRARAIAIAEAGLNEAYSRLSTNFALKDDPTAFPLTTYAGGSYDVTVSNVDAMTVVLTSTGKCSSSSASVKADVRDYGGPTNDYTEWPGSITGFAVLCGQTFTFGGCGNVSGTNGVHLLHSNSQLDINGNSGVGMDLSSSTKITIGNNTTINGDLTAPVVTYTTNKVTFLDGAVVDPDAVTRAVVPQVKIPNVDLTPFQTWAQLNGQVMSNGFSMSGGTYTPSGGVCWVIGDVHISSSAKINGTIIATGNIKYSSSGNITASQYGFALASVRGSIEMSSSGTIDGILYAPKGNYTQTGNGILIGQIIVGGTVKKGGVSDVIVTDNPIPTPPDNSVWGASSNIPVISAWQE